MYQASIRQKKAFIGYKLHHHWSYLRLEKGLQSHRVEPLAREKLPKSNPVNPGLSILRDRGLKNYGIEIMHGRA